MAGKNYGGINQVPIPSRLVEKGIPGLGNLAYVLTRTYMVHLPLCRQAPISAREGFDRDYSTLTRWVGKSAATLEQLAQSINRFVLSGKAFFANDRSVRLLPPSKGKPKTACRWAYGRMGVMSAYEAVWPASRLV